MDASKTRLIAGLRLPGKVLEVGFARGVRHSRRGAVHLSISALLALACFLATTSPALAELSSAPDDTAETDGRVSAIVVAGDRIYLGGSFTHVDGVPRGGLAAIDATTGRLTGWNPGTDGRVLALAMSADGSRLYVGGDFDSVGGLTRNSMAAVDPVTGVVEKEWRASTNGTVRALALRGDRLYLGGSFLTVKGLARERLAVVDATTGEPDANWMPSADSHVRTLALSPDGDRVYIGGEFSLVSGQSRQHLAALDAATGALLADWHPSPPDYVHDLAASGTHVYVAGEGNAAEAFDAATGGIVWSLRGDGDIQAVAARGDKVYLGGHFHELAGQVRERLAAVDAATGAVDLEWTPVIPRSGQDDKGVWDIVGATGRKLHIGGDFSRVSNQSQQGYARFTDADVTPPTVAGVMPGNGATGVAPASDEVATFSEGMDASTLDGSTFTLRELGVSTPVAATTSYDPATKKITLNPSAWLARNATYTATLEGGTGGARDVVGNPLAADEVWTFTTAPLEAPVITSPAENSYNNTGKITLSGTAEPSSTIEIFDGEIPEDTSTTSAAGTWSGQLTGVSEGSHTYTAKATDAAGNTSAASNARTVIVDVTPPGTTIDSGPEGPISSASASFSFSSSEANSEFECRLDGVSFSACASPEAYTGLSDGSHTFEVRAIDAAGNADATPASRSWTVDITAPSVQPPKQGFPSNITLETSRVPIKLSWSATDDGSGVSRYELQQSTNGGPYSSVSLSSPTTTSLTHFLSPGNAYRFRVQAQDGAGNWSDWAQGPEFFIDAHQESSGAISYVGSWTLRASGSAYGGGLTYEKTKGAKATFTFTGRDVAWVATKGSNRGKAEVWMDGVKVKSVDLYSTTTQARRTVFVQHWPDSGPHTVEVRVLGTKNASSTDTRVDVDAFVALG